jgi:microtubule-associated protein-like 5
MIKHPTRKLIATGEVGIQPAIHIWDSQTLEPIVLLDTSHFGGVHLLAFSSDGKKLASIGMDRAFSIQIF